MTARSGRGPTRALIELIGRALIDQDLRDRLFDDPEAVARKYEVSAEEAAAIKRLDRAKFEHAAARLRWS
jgi:hypothetical protein